MLNIYLMGELSLFGVVLNPLNKYLFTGPALGAAKMVPQVAFSLSYMTWAYLQFFQPRRKWLAGLKAVLAVLSGYVFMLILISILVMIVIVLFWPLLKPIMTGQ